MTAAAQCSDSGSTDPQITIGWPVCPNDYFHREGRFWPKTRMQQLRYRGEHRAPEEYSWLGSWLPWSIVFGVILGIVFAVFFSIPAHADGDITNTEKLYGDTYHTAICSTIADYPSIGGVLGVWQGVQQHSGLTMDNAGDVIDYAVGTYCPQWTSLLQRTASAVTNAQHGQVV